ncbi:hypothetical protein DEO72_LG4g65 [Vigna unguiculata]|uniref:Uncharacterized protein n=1 Tax=Vigna unguiculata TaxID=3917 RepID=A0A4D6LKM9_VIGUN|nr:hypothetical protein DEO72_LG4g65 [Vigna unguiculata]
MDKLWSRSRKRLMVVVVSRLVSVWWPHLVMDGWRHDGYARGVVVQCRGGVVEFEGETRE